MQGRADSPLTNKGVRMAERLAPQLPSIDTVYSSPLGRTMHTAKILFGERDIRTDDRLREIHMGDWEGRLQADLDIEDATQHANFWKSPHLFEPASGEDFHAVKSRSVECLREVAKQHTGESIALVSHTTIIRAMLFSIDSRPLSAFWNPPAIYPASISEVNIENDQFSIAHFGNIDHYEPADIPTGAY